MENNIVTTIGDLPITDESIIDLIATIRFLIKHLAKFPSYSIEKQDKILNYFQAIYMPKIKFISPVIREMDKNELDSEVDLF